MLVFLHQDILDDALDHSKIYMQNKIKFKCFVKLLPLKKVTSILNCVYTQFLL